MSRTTEHRSHIGSRAALSRYDQIPACCSAGHRRGFTLVEVVVATSILLIILVPLMMSFGRGVSGFKNAQLFTFAQNLAEFQAEDLKSMAPSVLSQLVEGKYPGVYMDDGTTPDTSNPLVVYSNYKPARKAGDPDYNAVTDAAAAANDLLHYMYDSGNITTEFNLIGLTKILGNQYVAGPSLAPELPLGVPVLGLNIEILPYEDVDYASTQWRYYRAILHKEAYPLFSKRIQVTRYDAHYLPDKTHHASAGDVSDLFDYTITVSTRQSDGSLRVLYVTQGTIGSAFKSTPTTVTVTVPVAGASWNTTGAVTWNLSGDTGGVFAYKVCFSTSNDGITYGPYNAPRVVVPVVVPVSDPLTVMVDPGVKDVWCKVMVEAVSAKGQVLGYDTSDGFTVGIPGGLFLNVTDPTGGSLWTTGQVQTVSWSTPVWMTVRQILVELSTNGVDGPWSDAVIVPGNVPSTLLTPTTSSVNCVVRVTARGPGGAPIVGGMDTSDRFTTQDPLVITVNAPTSSSMWTTNVAGEVAWSLNRSEPAITSYSINFLGGVTGGPVTVGAGFTSVNITPTSTSVSCTVRVTALDAAGHIVLSGGSGVFGDSQPFHVLAPPSVTVLKPDGATLQGGSSFVVRWVTNGNTATVAGFNVLLSVDNGATYVRYATAAAGAASAPITLPGGTNYNKCYVRVDAVDSTNAVIASKTSAQFQIKK